MAADNGKSLVQTSRSGCLKTLFLSLRFAPKTRSRTSANVVDQLTCANASIIKGATSAGNEQTGNLYLPPIVRDTETSHRGERSLPVYFASTYTSSRKLDALNNVENAQD